MAGKDPKKKSTPLWMYGFLCFVGATVATQINGPPQNRSEALGQGVGSLVLVFVGIMLIIAHFLRRKR